MSGDRYRVDLTICNEFDPYPAVADEAAGSVEHRFTADLEPLLRAVRIGATDYEVEKRLALDDLRLQRFALCRVPPVRGVVAGFADERIDADAEHFQRRTRHFREGAVLVLFPVPV